MSWDQDDQDILDESKAKLKELIKAGLRSKSSENPVTETDKEFLSISSLKGIISEYENKKEKFSPYVIERH